MRAAPWTRSRRRSPRPGSPDTCRPWATGSSTAATGTPRPSSSTTTSLASIDDLARLAPLHNPPAAEGIRRARAAFAGLPQVAVFDTAFFAGLPAAAATYALDRELTEREDIRRYGMHGTSHQYVAAEAAAFLGGRSPSWT